MARNKPSILQYKAKLKTSSRVWTAMEIQNYKRLGTPNLECMGEIMQMTQNQNWISIYIGRYQTPTVRLILLVLLLEMEPV